MDPGSVDLRRRSRRCTNVWSARHVAFCATAVCQEEYGKEPPEALEFTPVTVVDEAMNWGLSMRSADGTVVTKTVREFVEEALANGAEVPFLFHRMVSQSLYLVGWSGDQKHLIIAHGGEEALYYYFKLIGEDKRKEIDERSMGMSCPDFLESIVWPVSADAIMEIMDGDKQTSNYAGEIVRRAVANAEECPQLLGMANVVSPYSPWELPRITWIRSLPQPKRYYCDEDFDPHRFHPF